MVVDRVGQAARTLRKVARVAKHRRPSHSCVAYDRQPIATGPGSPKHLMPK